MSAALDLFGQALSFADLSAGERARRLYELADMADAGSAERAELQRRGAAAQREADAARELAVDAQERREAAQEAARLRAASSRQGRAAR